eukprot:gene13233-11784_t
MSMPLGRVIDATTQKVYGDLSMMVDLMRDMRPDEDARRKKDLADFVNVNRKRLMRLLVVLKWLPQAPNAAKAAEILEATGKRSLIYGATANGLHQHWETAAVLHHCFCTASSADACTSSSIVGMAEPSPSPEVDRRS